MAFQLPTMAEINAFAGSNGLARAHPHSWEDVVALKPKFFGRLNAEVETPMACRTENPNIFTFCISERSPTPISRELVSKLDDSILSASGRLAHLLSLWVLTKEALHYAISFAAGSFDIRQLVRPAAWALGLADRHSVGTVNLGSTCAHSCTRIGTIPTTSLDDAASRDFELRVACPAISLDRIKRKIAFAGAIVAPLLRIARSHEGDAASSANNRVIYPWLSHANTMTGQSE